MQATHRLREPRRLAVVGAGSWGTALAYHLAKNDLEVDLWVYESEVYEEIKSHRENLTYLPGVHLNDSVRPYRSIEQVVRGKSVVVLVVPSHVMREVLSRMVRYIEPGAILVSASKGIENDTLMTMSQVLEDVLPDNLAYHRAVLVGPSFAREVGRDMPTAITLACLDHSASRLVQGQFASPCMRVYTSQDLVGVELGGALKNVFAIGTGISDGLGMGNNARAALITRSLAEMVRLGVKMGANPLTFMGLAGLGDLVLTCTGDLSRNRTVGFKLGQGQRLNDILSEMKMVAEGVKTTKAAYDLAKREAVDMPVTEQIYKILYEDKDPQTCLLELMTRHLKDEIDRALAI